MELQKIITFIQVAQSKSFSKAAKQLGYSQAAVTIQIKQLEQELNVCLFDRINKQTTLTREGALFYPHAISVIKEMKNAEASVVPPSRLTGSLRLGTIESICSSIFEGLLREYHQLYPEVNIQLIIDSPGPLLDMLDSNAVDIVYFLDKRIYDNKWIKVLEKPEDIVFVASSNHPFVGMKNLNLDIVIEQPFILTEKNASYRFTLDQYLAAMGKEIHPFLESGNTEFIISFLKKNLGVSFLPKFTVQEGISKGELAVLEAEDFHMRLYRQIVYHKDKWITKEMEAFIHLAKA